MRGRWTPDLPVVELPDSVNFVLAHLEGQVKVLGEGIADTNRSEDDGKVARSFLVLEFADGSVELVFPELVGKLVAFSSFRGRDPTLLSSLRLRALDWCKTFGLSGPTTVMALQGGIRCAWGVSCKEASLLKSLGIEALAKPPPSSA